MGFEDIEQELKRLFEKGQCPKNTALQNRVFLKASEAFVCKKEKNARPLWSRLFSFRTSTLAFALTAFFVLFNMLPGQTILSAGEVVPKSGPVEIIRGDDIILVQNPTALINGDVIRVGNNSEADIIFPKKFTSTVTSSTQVRVVDSDTIFLETGSIENNIYAGGEFSTKRGFVQSVPGSSFYISVSPSGETKIINLSEAQKVSVYDWKEGETLLQAGEEVRLRSETSLAGEEEFPEDISLSLLQIQTIRNKLIIARTKLLTSAEDSIAGDKKASRKNLESAKNTFLSIVQVLNTSRDLRPTLVRKNIDSIALADVARSLAQKISNESLIAETKALENLFLLVERNQGNMGFQIEKTEITSFDRFLLLDYISALGTEEEQAWINILKQKYVASFMRKILNEELKTDQIKVLGKEMRRLPRNALARNFLERGEALAPPEIATQLQNEINASF